MLAFVFVKTEVHISLNIFEASTGALVVTIYLPNGSVSVTVQTIQMVDYRFFSLRWFHFMSGFYGRTYLSRLLKCLLKEKSRSAGILVHQLSSSIVTC